MSQMNRFQTWWRRRRELSRERANQRTLAALRRGPLSAEDQQAREQRAIENQLQNNMLFPGPIPGFDDEPKR